MPTLTFYNLPEEKKEKLLRSALEEFTNYSLQDVSINRIIKNAGISRGSFYMYFENKEDLYDYALKKHKDRFFALFEDILIKEKGNPFSAYPLIFQVLIDFISKEENLKLFKHIFSGMNFHVHDHIFLQQQRIEKTLLAMMDTSQIKKGKEKDLLFLLNDLLIKELICAILLNRDAKEAQESFCQKLEIIQYGGQK